MKLIIIFIALSIINVIGSTIRSLVTINLGKFVSALANALYFGFYNVVLIYSVAEFSLIAKICITAFCNFVGVYFVKLAEEKMKKVKLYKVEATLFKNRGKFTETYEKLVNAEIPCNYIELGDKYVVFNCYCYTKEQTKATKQILDEAEAQYFVSETKNI